MDYDSQGKAGVLFLHPWTGFYGAETCLYLLIKYLNRESYHPVVVLPDVGPLHTKLQSIDVPVILSPLRSLPFKDGSADAVLRWMADLPERVRRIVDLIHSRDIRIIHSNEFVILEGAIAAKLTGRPHICSVRTPFFFRPYTKGLVPRNNVLEVLDSLTLMIVPMSNTIMDSLRPFVNPTKLHVIYSSIETQSFEAQYFNDSSSSAFPQASKSREPRICSIGRIDPQKGLDLLIDAAALVVKAHPSAQFSVFGPIQEEVHYQQLVQQINRLHLTDNVHFEGHTDRVPEQLKASDLLVFPSKDEGFGLVVLEAMAAGKPVVSTRCGGPEEIIIDGTTGYLVPLNDPRALADAIIKVIEDPEHARQMGRKGQERVQQHFAVPRHTSEQYEALYREVLDCEVTGPTQDKSGEAVLIEAILQTLDKHSGEFYEIGHRFKSLKHFEAKVKKTLAYKAYETAKNLARKLRKLES